MSSKKTKTKTKTRTLTSLCLFRISCAAKATITARCIHKVTRQLKFGSVNRSEHHLRNAVLILNHHHFATQIDEAHFDLTPVVRIDGARRVRHSDALIDGPPATGSHLKFKPFRQLKA